MLKHKGSSMMMSIIFMLCVSTMLSSVATLAVGQKHTAKKAAIDSTKAYSFLAFADLAIDAVLYDLGYMSANVSKSLVGTDSGLGAYDTALSIMQDTLFIGAPPT